MKHTFLTLLFLWARARGRLVGIVCMLSVVATLPVAAQTADTINGVQQFVLRNGMVLIVKPDHRAPTAVHMLWVRVGSMDEVDGTSGVAHVLEHMMFKGTPTVKAGDFSRKVAALGGRENAFTSKDYTGYFQQIPAARLEDVMRLEADRFAHNQWSDEDFYKELEVVKEERRLRTDDNPRARLQEVLDAATWQTAPYRRPIVGWMSDLEALTPEDARSFYQRWYTPANAVVVVAGDVDAQQVYAWAQKHYGGLPARAVPARKPREEPAQRGLRRVEFKAPAEQAYVVLQFKVPAFAAQALEPGSSDPASEDALALEVLAAVLNGYDNARLDRALTQGPSPVADSAGAWCGLVARGPQLCALYGVPAAGKTVAQVEAALRAEVARVAKEGVPDAELARVKNQWIASEVYKQDSVFNQARILATHWINGFPLDADARIIARLRQVRSEHIQAVAARYFGDDALTIGSLLPQAVDKSRKPRVAPAGARH